MILPKDYKSMYKIINEMGANAIIYASPDMLSVLKIYRNSREFDEEQFRAFRDINHPDCMKPWDVIWTHDRNFAGFESDCIDGVSLPFLRGTDIQELIKASLEIKEVVKNISEAKFLIPDANPQNFMFSKTFKFVDVDEYLYLKTAIMRIISKIFSINMKVVNNAVLSGLVGLSYRHLILKYLSITSQRGREEFNNLSLSDEEFVYKVLTLLQDISKVDDLDELKMQILMPIEKK